MAHGWCGDQIGDHHRRVYMNEIETLAKRLGELKRDFSMAERKADAKKTFERSLSLLPPKKAKDLTEEDQIGGS